MRIVSVVGTRPQLIKAAALAPVLRREHDDVFVDTGQHWDVPATRARTLDLRPAGAADAISGALRGDPG